MKSINYLLTCMIGIFSLALTSCKKEIAEPAANEPAIMSTTTNGPICGPVRFRKHEWGVFTYTTTIMQKWYTNDRISNITFDFFGGRHSWGLYRGELEHRMPWGEVWYAGNQLYVKEVQKDLIVFRATLDASGKALATYYYNPHDPYNEVFTYDTLYYYYSGDRLDSVIRLNKRRHVMPTIHYSWEKYRFVYDSLGNIAGIHSVNNNSWVSFIYDYSRPVRGIVAHYDLTIPFKIAEYLDLVKLPMHYVIDNIVTAPPGTVNPGSPYFNNYTITNGLVYAYHNAANDYIFGKSYYTDWGCKTSSE